MGKKKKIDSNKSLNVNNSRNKSDKIRKLNNKLIKRKIRAKNPNYLYFNFNSSFIYESRLYLDYYSKLSDNNKMKPNNDEINLLKESINSIEELKGLETNPISIKIPLVYANFFDNMVKKPLILNQKELEIKNIIDTHNNIKSLSCSKISNIYNELYHNSISKKTVHRILTKKLNYSFRKTSIKNSKLLSTESMKQTFFVLKVILRIIKLGGELVYIDESAFYNQNNNFKMWRKGDQDIYFDIKENKKVNLILAVTSSKVVYYKITNDTTNSEAFTLFITELLDKLKDEEKQKYFFFMDNLSAHATASLFSLYYERKAKIIFNTPYRSNFNMVELCFRDIKRETYTHLYNDMEQLIKDIDKILNSEKFKKKLKNFYKSTLEQYLKYIVDNNSININ